MISDDTRRQFPGAAGYLNTASIGLPPQRTVSAMQRAIAEWQEGLATAPGYDIHVDSARQSFAELVSVPVEAIAMGAQVSALVSLVATALTPGSTVLCPEGDFTSVIFPFLARDDLDLTVEFAPLDGLAEAVHPQVDLVAFSAVQSADGRVADLAAIKAAAAAADALTMVDATQALGWMPLEATEFDFFVAGTYKWLLSPRGTAFLAVRPSLMDRLTPLYAGWYAGELPWESIYGPPLRLASSARRFDLSPGWLAWVGTAPALELVAKIGVETIQQHNVALSNSLLDQLGMESTNSAIVSLDVGPDFDRGRLAALNTSFRAGRLRIGFHLYNTEEDVARLVTAVADYQETPLP